MNRFIKISLGFLVSVNCSQAQIIQKWLQLGTGTSKNLTSQPSMIFDKNGHLYLAYTDQSSPQNKATLKKFDGQTWTTLSSQFTPGQAQFVSLQLDTGGVPCVAFQEPCPVTKKITVMRFNGGGWDTIGSRGFATADFNNPELSFAIDYNNNMYVAYRENSSGKASIARYFGTSWTGANSTDITEGDATKLSLNVETNNVLLAFNNGFKGGKLSVITQTIGGGWVYTQSDTVLSNGPVDYVTCKRYANQAVSFNGVTYKDLSDGKAYFITKLDNAIWTTPYAVSEGLANYISPARRLPGTWDGYLYCGYADGTSSGNATVKKMQVSIKTNTTVVGKKGFTDTLGIFAGAFFATMGIDKQDSLYMAVQSFNEYVVFKYRSINTNLTGIEESSYNDSFQVFPNPAYDKSLLTIQGSALQNLRVYSFDGKILYEKNGSLPEHFELEVNHLVPGIYFVELKQGEHLFRKKVIRE